jgi:hypothetical protein
MSTVHPGKSELDSSRVKGIWKSIPRMKTLFGRQHKTFCQNGKNRPRPFPQPGHWEYSKQEPIGGLQLLAARLSPASMAI